MRTIFQIILLVALSLNCRAQIVPILRNVFTTNDFDKAIVGGAIPYFDYPSGKFVGSPTAYVNAILYDPTLGFLSIIHTNDTGDLLLQLGVSSSSGPSIQAYADKLVVANTNLTFDAVGPYSIRLRINGSNVLEAVAGSISLSGKTNLVADNGTALTYNGTPIGSIQSFYFGSQYGFSYGNIIPTNIRSSNLPAGTNDLFTIPAGFRCIITSIRTGTTNGSTSTNYSMLKTNGTYYRWSGNSTLSISAPGNLITATGDNFMWESGDTVAVFQGLVGANVIVSGLLFSTNINAYSPRIMAVTTATNILYTCPSGKVALNMPTPNPLYGGSPDLLIQMRNDSGASRQHSFWNVPSGSSPGPSNFQSISGTANFGVQGKPASMLFPGDFLAVSSDSSTAVQWAYTTVIELPFP